MRISKEGVEPSGHEVKLQTKHRFHMMVMIIILTRGVSLGIGPHYSFVQEDEVGKRR